MSGDSQAAARCTAASALTGRRILVTRAPHQATELSQSLRALGAVPVEVPVLAIAPPEDFTALDLALGSLAAFDWIVFTSANAVRALVARAAELGRPTAAATLSVAAIGRATASAAREAGFSVALVPEHAVGESLAAALALRVAGRRVLLVRAVVARDLVPDALRAAGADLVIAEAYRNVVPESSIPLLVRAVGQGIDAATFTSSSSVTHLAALAAAASIPFPLPGVPAVSIGPITSATLGEHHWPPAVEASRAEIPALIAAVQSLFAAG